MPHVIPETQITAVERLLAQGERLRDSVIASLTGVSRATVIRIRRGQRHVKIRTARTILPQEQGPPRRCPGCGGMIYGECFVCNSARPAQHRRQELQRAIFELGREQRRSPSCV